MTTARFAIRARADPQTMPRLANHFAQLGLVPSRMRMEAQDGVVTMTIDQEGLDERQAAIVAEKMRASVLVEDVYLMHVTRSGVCLAARSEGAEVAA